MVDIAELRRLEAEATPGPWRVVVDDDGNPLSGRPSISASEELDCGIIHWDGFIQEYWRSARGDKEIHANAALIVAMRNALPELLKALEPPVAWRYRYIVSIYGDWSDWFIVDDPSSIPPRKDQTIQPLYTLPPHGGEDAE